MALADEYERQFAWRSWPRIFDALPSVSGARILDLGCGRGDHAAELVRRGAVVVGIDANEELIGVARSRRLQNAEFRLGNLRDLASGDDRFDGIWCSFAAAYFPDLASALAAWQTSLKAGGWIALTEVDNLFGHEPLDGSTAALLDGYAAEALSAGRYDFHMGHKLARHASDAGLTVANEFTVPDQELSFDGPADDDVVIAWSERFDRMTLLHSYCGAEFPKVRADFLHCLKTPQHRSIAKVHCCIAVK